MADLTLYGHPLSGHTYKVRLLLGFLGLDYEERSVDIPAGEHKQPAFRSINPLEKVPVLVDESGDPLHDSQAILVYLAGRHGADDWWPEKPLEQGKVVQWLSFAANELHHGPNLARLHFLLNAPVDVAAAQEQTRQALRLLNDHLSGRAWLELGRPTIADVATYPYVALAPEGKVSLEPYDAINAWMTRFAAIPGFQSMTGI